MESLSEPTMQPSQSSSTPAPSDATPPSLMRPHKRFGGAMWMYIEHQANVKRNSKISGIWEHGEEYINMSEPDSHHRWFCNHCKNSIRLHDSKTTSNVKRHLKRTHGIKINRTEEAQDETEEEEEEGQPNLSLITSYLNRVDIERFRELLIRWLV